jgi:hypothetical protein
MTQTVQRPRAASNGSEPETGEQPTVVLPVERYRDAARELRRPFAANAVKFKVQATWPRGAPNAALIVPYVDSRLVVERLNLVCPHLWSERFERDGSLLWCHMTIDGVTRSDVGEGYQGKGLISDARKRAAVQFGVAVSLYATPKIVLKVDSGPVLRKVRTRDGESLGLTDVGERECRQLYQNWLDVHGESHFGRVLDHGDVEDSLGDEGERSPEREPAPADPPPSAPPQDDPEQALAALLAADHPLAAQRAEANASMLEVGANAGQRLRELRAAGDERAMNALLDRLTAASEKTP